MTTLRTRSLSLVVRWLVLAFGFSVLCATSALQPAMLNATPPPTTPSTDDQGRARIVVTLSPTALESVDHSELRLSVSAAGEEPIEGRLWLPGYDVQSPIRGTEAQVTGYHRACEMEEDEDGQPLPCTIELHLELSRPARLHVEASLVDNGRSGFPFGRNGSFGAGANIQVSVR